MSNWISGKLGDFIQLQRGYDLPEYDREQGNVPVVTSSGISGTHSIAKVKGPGVVMGRYGTLGNIYYVEDDYWPHNTTLFVKNFGGNDPRFIAYFLRTLHYQAHSDKSSVPGLNRNDLYTISVAIPSLPEQKDIARILGALDDKIELNRRMNATLEATARALFKSWFVDFDPVRAKAEGRQPEGMDAETAALFPDDFEESALGLIPVGWRVSTVGDEFKIIMGQSPPGDTYNENGEGMPFYQGRRDFGFRFPTQRVYCTRPTRFAEAGDTLVSVRAPVGDLNMALVPCSIGRGVGAMRHRSDSRSFTYYAAHFLKPYFDYYNGEGTVFGAINSADFRKIPFLYVPSALVEQFDRLVSAFDDSIENNERSNVSLAETRDTLLPKLISGEVRVRSL